jgi:hypothetical protein
LILKCVIYWFQAFAFKWVNLYRYAAYKAMVFQASEDSKVGAVQVEYS